MNRGLIIGLIILVLSFLGCIEVKAGTTADTKPAGASCIKAYDMMGREVLFDEKGEAVNVGPVIFELDNRGLEKGECYIYDDGSTYNPVEDHEYIMYPKAEKSRVVFLKKNSEGDLYRIEGGEYTVIFESEIKETILPVIRKTKTGYRISLYPVKGTHVFCEIRGRKNGMCDEIVRETDIDITSKGKYEICIYTEDGIGRRRYVKTPKILEIGGRSGTAA